MVYQQVRLPEISESINAGNTTPDELPALGYDFCAPGNAVNYVILSALRDYFQHTTTRCCRCVARCLLLRNNLSSYDTRHYFFQPPLAVDHVDFPALTHTQHRIRGEEMQKRVSRGKPTLHYVDFCQIRLVILRWNSVNIYIK